jgi:hypothetical protein
MALTKEEQLELLMDPYGMGKKTSDNRNKRQAQRAKAKAIAEAKVLAEAKAKAANKFNSPSNAVQRTYSPSSIFDTSGAEADRIWNSGARDRFEPVAMARQSGNDVAGKVRVDTGKGNFEIWKNPDELISYGDGQAIRNSAIQANTQVVQAPVFSGGQGVITEDRSNVTPVVAKKQYVPQGDPFAGSYDNSYWDNMEEATPDWGANPGFHKTLNDNGNQQKFWTADNDSGFWQTDAGVDKARETWGEGSLPSFVKQPKQKEIDIQGIKNWFSENWGK